MFDSMRKIFIYTLFLLMLLGCKQVYEPDINNTHTAVVIEGLITDNPGQASVKLSRAVSFDSTDSRVFINDANVSIVDDLNTIISLSNTGHGIYSDPYFAGTPGRSYKLNVITPEGDVYESDMQSMVKPFKQDSIYANYTTKSVLRANTYGDYYETQTKGLETYVDLSSGSNELPKCRYISYVTVLYTYEIDNKPPLTVYCWKTFTPNNQLNVTSAKFDKIQGRINQHSLCFFSNVLSLYDSREDLKLEGWLLTLVKYNLNKESQHYYAGIQNQLMASGRVFDPLPSQLKGNIKCKSDPKKLVFGFFDVSAIEKLYFRYNIDETISLTQKDDFPGFTSDGESANVAPPFWYK